jgi:hypothetical protein
MTPRTFAAFPFAQTTFTESVTILVVEFRAHDRYVCSGVDDDVATRNTGNLTRNGDVLLTAAADTNHVGGLVALLFSLRGRHPWAVDSDVTMLVDDLLLVLRR